jgi:uncharacterized membrane protein YagU involved in acid resistance
MNDSDDKWQKLVSAARKRLPEPETPPPPKDFVQRVIGLKQAIIAFSKVLFWRRWSLWVAVVCAIAFVIVFLILRATAPKAPLITPPAPPLNPDIHR